MIAVDNKEIAVRTIEAFNAFSTVLPIYDAEARSVFRATFQVDMADLLPEFFRSLALIALKNKKEFDSYLDYFSELIRYVKNERKTIPKPLDANDEIFTSVRTTAEKLLNAWMVKEKK